MTEQELIKAANDPLFVSKLESMKRSELLPFLFRVKGKPFSLNGREQFDTLFAKEMVRETIVMSGRQCGKCKKCTKKEDYLTLREYWNQVEWIELPHGIDKVILIQIVIAP